MMKKLKIFLALGIFSSTLNAQIVTLNPVFATQNDVVTVTYDATQGNGQLAGQPAVYIHTGVILEGENGWQNVPTAWGATTPVETMTAIGNDLHQKTINITEYYNLQPGDVVLQLAFVFRNANGSLEGKTADGGDIFVDLFTNEFTGTITSPSGVQLFQNPPSNLAFSGQTNETADIVLYQDNVVVESVVNTTIASTTLNFSGDPSGQYWLWMSATKDGVTVYDSTYIILQGAPIVQNPPAGTMDGMNYIDDNTVILQLLAPNKDFVYVLGDFNNWQFDLDYFMKVNTAGDRYWLQLNNLNAGQEYRYQYSIDQQDLRVADMYAEKVLDPWNDQWISDATYPNLIPYPAGMTNEIVSVLQTAQQPYNWNVNDFQRPPKERLVIYELLVRDFTALHTYQSLIDTLDYLDDLGINVVQLMPVQEFEGNESWGYNPSFFFAVDKYYGPADDLKAFVDECHARGIAVIIDIVFNHSFGQNPQVRMYSENGAAGPPTAENPWLNVQAQHPFNVGYDYDHSSVHTQQFMERNLRHWVENFKIDGFRFDLSKGFTQNFTNNVGAWNQYDQSRVDNWIRIRNEIYSYDDQVYLILEHLGDNPEETVLANNGFMLWGNINHEYNEATMGYNSNLNWASYQTRGWNSPHLVSYAESHDEERLMYKNLLFGNSNNPAHDAGDLEVALSRMETAAAFNIPLPGPKMIWQFGELGYDYSINHCPDGTVNINCRTSNKPIRWDYYDVAERQRLYKVYAALNKLKTENDAFSSTNYNWDVAGFGKRLIIQHNTMDVVVIGNFSVTPIEMIPGFTQTGTWYDYFAGESIVENNLNNAFQLQPGEYRIYTTVELETPDVSVGLEEITFEGGSFLGTYPNPFTDFTQISYRLDSPQKTTVRVLDIQGRVVAELFSGQQTTGNHMITWSANADSRTNLSNGIYMIQLITDSGVATSKVVYQR